MYKFYCDLCGKEPEYEGEEKATLTFEGTLGSTYSEFPKVNVEMCATCARSFEEWAQSRRYQEVVLEKPPVAKKKKAV